MGTQNPVQTPEKPPQMPAQEPPPYGGHAGLPSDEEPEEAPPEHISVDDKLDALEARAGGAERLRRVLLKRVKNGDEKAKKVLQAIVQKEKEEQEWAKQAVAKIQAKRDTALAASRAKYAEKYPRVDI